MSQLEIEINDMSNNKISTVIDSPPVIDTSDLDLNYYLDKDATIDVSDNKKLKTSNEPGLLLATTKITGLFPTTSNSRKT